MAQKTPEMNSAIEEDLCAQPRNAMGLESCLLECDLEWVAGPTQTMYGFLICSMLADSFLAGLLWTAVTMTILWSTQCLIKPALEKLQFLFSPH